MKTSIFLQFIILFTCFLLAGCGTWHWKGAGKPVHPLEKDIIHCKNQAYQKFPSKNYYQKIVQQDVSAVRDGAHGVTIRPIERIDIQVQDANQQDRDNAFKKCMNDIGWKLEY